MIHYLDSGANPTAYPAKWYEDNLTKDVIAFRGQFGFFRYRAFEQFHETLDGVVSAGGSIRLVVGSNPTEPLSIQDLKPLIPLLEDGKDTKITLVSFGNALFHPKVAHITYADNEAKAIVGSANFTLQGLGTHVEAWVEMAESSNTAMSLQDIAAAIDRWSMLDELGVFQLTSMEDLADLLTEGIILDKPPNRGSTSSSGGAGTESKRGRRKTRWRPPKPLATDTEGSGDSTSEVPMDEGSAGNASDTEVGSAEATEVATEPTAPAPTSAADVDVEEAEVAANFAMLLAHFDVSHRTGVPGTPEMSLPGDVEPFFGPLGYDNRNRAHAGRHFLVQVAEGDGAVRTEEFRAWRREAGAGGNADFRLRVTHTVVDMTNPAGGDILHIQRIEGSNPEFLVRIVPPEHDEFETLSGHCDQSGGRGGASGQKMYGLW